MPVALGLPLPLRVRVTLPEGVALVLRVPVSLALPLGVLVGEPLRLRVCEYEPDHVCEGDCETDADDDAELVALAVNDADGVKDPVLLPELVADGEGVALVEGLTVPVGDPLALRVCDGDPVVDPDTDGEGVVLSEEDWVPLGEPLRLRVCVGEPDAVGLIEAVLLSEGLSDAVIEADGVPVAESVGVCV